jgi:hypothetical protein
MSFLLVLADVNQSLLNIANFIVLVGGGAATVAYAIAGLLLMFPGEYGERRGAGLSLIQRITLGVLVLGLSRVIAQVLLAGVPGINNGQPLIQ